MGELPPALLTGEQQAPLVPRKLCFPDGYGKAITLNSKPSQGRLKPSPESNTAEAESIGSKGTVDPANPVPGADSLHGKG
jgi:hypothetical protein